MFLQKRVLFDTVALVCLNVHINSEKNVKNELRFWLYMSHHRLTSSHSFEWLHANYSVLPTIVMNDSTFKTYTYIKRYAGMAWQWVRRINISILDLNSLVPVGMLTSIWTTYCAWFPGAEKRTYSEMQRRRFQDVQEDEPQEKRESIEDLLLRELTRGEYIPKGKYMSLINRVRCPYCKIQSDAFLRHDNSPVPRYVSVTWIALLQNELDEIMFALIIACLLFEIILSVLTSLNMPLWFLIIGSFLSGPK